jgi:flagellar assembly protein FliH
MSKDKLRQYLRPDGEPVRHWSWPDMGEAKASAEPRGNALGYRFPEPEPEPVVELEAEPEPEPLTAEALEAIRQAAYDEGIAEGRAKGFEQGREEGRLKGLQEGHAAGLEQGLEQGLAEGRERIDALCGQWQQLVDQLVAPLARVDHRVEQSLVTLAMELARNLLKAEARTSPRLLLATVQEAVAALPGHEPRITFFLHGQDLALLREQFDDDSLARRGWELVEDPLLEPGRLRLKTAMSELETDLHQRIDALMTNFMKANWNRFHDPE